MNKDIYLKKKLTSSWFFQLQQTICDEFQKIEIEFGKKTKQKPKYFKNSLTPQFHLFSTYIGPWLGQGQ